MNWSNTDSVEYSVPLTSLPIRLYESGLALMS